MDEKDMIDEIIDAIKESVFSDERFVALTKKDEAVEEVATEEVIEETPEEEKVEEVVEDKRTTIEKIRDRLKGIK